MIAQDNALYSLKQVCEHLDKKTEVKLDCNGEINLS